MNSHDMVLSTDQYDHLRHKTWSTPSEVLEDLASKKTNISSLLAKKMEDLFHRNRLVGKKDTRSHLQI